MTIKHRNSLDIRLAESVVFLRAGDATGRFRGPISDPPAMLRGLLVLTLVKPTKITSIEVELTCKTSTAWPEGVSARRIDVSEEHKLYSQSYVYFDAAATSLPSHRRTHSVGPGLAFDHEDEDHSEDSSLRHQGASSSLSQIQNPPLTSTTQQSEWERRGRGLTRSRTRGRPPQRHMSVDQTNYQADYIAHHDCRLTPPYSPVHSLSRRTSLSQRRSPMDTLEEIQETNGTVSSPSELEVLPGRLATNPGSDSDSSITGIPRSFQRHSNPSSPIIPTSDESGLSSPILPAEPSSSEFIVGNSTGSAYTHVSAQTQSPMSELTQLSDTSSRATSPTVADETHSTRGRKSKRFTFANAFFDAFDAVKDRVRSVPHPDSTNRDPTVLRNGERTPIRGLTPIRSVTPVDTSRETTPARARSRARDRGRSRERRMSPDRWKGPVVDTTDHPHTEDKKQYAEGWKEFKKGVYTYPVSFAIPVNSSPSLSCEYGTVVWRLKAVAHRPGTFKSKLSASQEVTVVASPGEDDTEDTENIIVERTWDDQMQYLITVSGRSFHVGGTLPVSLTFAPWTKMKIFKLSVIIEERIEYLTHFKRVAKTESINRISILSLSPAQRDTPLLPLSPDDPDAFANSPLHDLLAPGEDPGDVASEYMGPGPWHIQSEIPLPKSCSQLHFTNRNKRSNILISHVLKVVFRVQRADDRDLDPVTAKRKLYDIVVQTPIHILSCLCNPTYTSLPPYSGELSTIPDGGCLCDRSSKVHTIVDAASVVSPITPSPSAPPASPLPSHRWPISRLASTTTQSSIFATFDTHRPSGHTTPTRDLSRENSTYNQFERLITGRETELGEAPPSYDEVVAAS